MQISKFTLISPKIALDKLLPALETVMTPEIVESARRYAEPQRRIANKSNQINIVLENYSTEIFTTAKK